MNTVYDNLRQWMDAVPVIESHEHYVGYTEPIDDPIALVTDNYLWSDLESAAGISDAKSLQILKDPSASFETRLSFFERLWSTVKYTGYGRGVALGFRAVWDIEINRDGLQQLYERRSERTTVMQEKYIGRYGIKAAVCDVGSGPVIRGETKPIAPWCRFAIGVPQWHNLHNFMDIQNVARDMGAVSAITSLDDYLEVMENFVARCVDWGFVCFKDQTAYRRDIGYGMPSRAEAESVFNKMLASPRDVVGDDQARVLDDWIFHQIVRLARKFALPIQIHTGHMAGIRNDIRKTNAALLTPVLELYRDVHFDLFHGNWPYMGEYLYLGKNYPNVSLNLCWVNCIDPMYSIELMKRAILTVPTNKILAYGGDTRSFETQIGYLIQARDNVAVALAELVNENRIGIDDARQIALDWFFNNPNRIFKLGF